MGLFDEPADWQVFFDTGPGGAAEVVTYHPAAAADVELPALFTAAHALVAGGGGGVGVSTATPILTIPDAQQWGVVPAVGDEVTRRAVLYRVADIQPDGSGLIRLILERA